MPWPLVMPKFAVLPCQFTVNSEGGRVPIQHRFTRNEYRVPGGGGDGGGDREEYEDIDEDVYGDIPPDVTRYVQPLLVPFDWQGVPPLGSQVTLGLSYQDGMLDHYDNNTGNFGPPLGREYLLDTGNLYPLGGPLPPFDAQGNSPLYKLVQANNPGLGVGVFPVVMYDPSGSYDRTWIINHQRLALPVFWSVGTVLAFMVGPRIVGSVGADIYSSG
jgi:hypothetical protein